MITEFIAHISDKNKEYVIFDVGSRDCVQSIEFYNMFPNSKIFAFECNPNTLPICRKNIARYSDRITLIEGAVCDYDGEIKFYPIDQDKTITTWKDGNPGASSLFVSNGEYTIEKYVQYEIVTNCHRLDTIMNKYNISNVDIIWMDVQGAELLAFKGLGKYLDNVQYIHTEVSHKEMYTGQIMFKELNDYILSKDFTIKNKISGFGWQEDIIYEKKKTLLFDIVIPVGPEDREIIRKQIEFTKKNVIGYRNIYLLCYDPTIRIEGCITIDEKIFPFTIDTVASFHGKLNRNGWYLQQLLKIYTGLVIPNILERYLVIDSDTFFIKPTTFIENDKCMYNYDDKCWDPYFDHMYKLVNFKNQTTLSGICHHMMFETKYVKELIKLVENKHGDTFYNTFLKLVSNTEYNGSGASEYEIYLNFILKHHRDNITIRELKWVNTIKFDVTIDTDFTNEPYNYVSYHWFDRK
jgi:FkbM family methyltransferase